MLRKGTILLAVILGWTILSGVAAPAQDTQTSPKAAAQPDSSAEGKTKSQGWDKPLEQYRLDFSINEIEDGKKINSRQYSMNLATNDGNEIKIGTRIPVESKEGEFQYLDVGTSLFARIGETRGQSELTVRAEISNFAMPESSLEKHESRPDLHPIIRQLKMGGSVLMPLPKTIVIGSADDPNSKREFQLEVTVTKLR
jgi:hypothetical protein